MTIQTYIAVLHGGPTPTSAGEHIVCPLQPDGSPKPILDHHGVLYRLMQRQHTPGSYDYQPSEPT